MSRWHEVEKLILALFPTLRGRWSPEISALYERSLSHLPTKYVFLAIEHHAKLSHYAPRPGPIIETARQLMPQQAKAQKDANELARHRQLAEESWRRAYDLVFGIGKEESLIHKKTCLEYDWRLRHLTDRPILSRAWVAIISMRVEQGIQASQPSGDIPCQSPKSNAENDKATLDQAMLPLSWD